MEGDTTALRLCLERILPPRRDRPVTIDLPAVETAEDILGALTIVSSALSSGHITPGDAATIAAVLETKRKTIETLNLEHRIVALEEVTKK